MNCKLASIEADKCSNIARNFGTNMPVKYSEPNLSAEINLLSPTLTTIYANLEQIVLLQMVAYDPFVIVASIAASISRLNAVLVL